VTSEKTMTVNTIAVASVSSATKKNGIPTRAVPRTRARPRPGRRERCVRAPRAAPEDAEHPENRERDDESVGEPRIDVRTEEQRQGADPDRAGDACIVCISIRRPSIPMVSNRPLTAGLVAKRAMFSAQV